MPDRPAAPIERDGDSTPQTRTSPPTQPQGLLHDYPPREFKDCVHLSHRQVDLLVDLIKDSKHLLKFPNVPHPPVKTQLLAALACLASQTITKEQAAALVGVDPILLGTFTWRCVLAIEERLSPLFLLWPDQARKEHISKSFKYASGFPHCIGILDSIPIPLRTKPLLDPVSWRVRKDIYAVGCTAVCDHKGAFTYASVGYVGSWRDIQAYGATRLHSESSRFFQGQEYILSDVNYTISTTVIPGYRPYRGLGEFKGVVPTTPDQEVFNMYHEKARSKIEYALGLLLHKFPSLRSLPVEIEKRRDIDRASSWIMACMLLHNFCLAHADEDADADASETDDAEENWKRQMGEGEEPKNGGEFYAAGNGPTKDGNGAKDEGRARRERLLAWLMRNKDGVGNTEYSWDE